MHRTVAGEPLWVISVTLLVVVFTAWLLGGLARWLLRERARLSLATAMVLAIVGTAVGLLIAYAVDSDARLRSGLAIGLAVAMTVAAIFVYGAVAAALTRSERPTAAELIGAGESDRLEFKSTARVNLRTGEKDPRMEQVILKTVAAFLNADGGTLLIGVADDGTPLGLAPDYETLRTPDADRFELWLRDLFTTGLGQTPAASVSVHFDDVETADGPLPVCQVVCGRSPSPVYLRPGKNAPPEFWVRTGNSTRQLSVDQAAEYVMHRWPLSPGASLAAQVKAAVRFSVEQ